MATVLVVDDDPVNREFLRTLLDYRGHQVREAGDGNAALELIGEQTPDAVITDVLMPGLDGYELARALRAKPATMDIPIAFNTAHFAERDIRPLALAYGVREVIIKPAAPTRVLAVVDALLRTARNGDHPAGHGVGSTAIGTGGPADDRRPGGVTDLLVKAANPGPGGGEAALRDELADLTRRLAETHRVARSGTWELDPRADAVVLSAGLRDLLGFGSSRVRRRQLWHHVFPDDLATMLALAEQVSRTGAPRITELRVADMDGVVHELIVSCRVAVGPDSTRAGRTLWGVAQDVTGIRDAVRDRLRAQSNWHDERDALNALQHAMLPRQLPETPGADLAAVYLPAPDRLDIGGNWYDALRLPGDRILASVGDVAGHDRYAAAVMGEVRTALHAYAVENPDPVEVLTRLNRYVLATHDDNTYVTAAVALYEPATRVVSVANAGHPAPLLVVPAPHAGDEPRFAPLAGHGPALGIVTDAVFDRQRLALPPGALLCAYTKGLTERLSDPMRAGTQRLARTIAEALADTGGPHQPTPTARYLADHIIHDTVLGPPVDDDVCLLILRTPAPG